MIIPNSRELNQHELTVMLDIVKLLFVDDQTNLGRHVDVSQLQYFLSKRVYIYVFHFSLQLLSEAK